MREILPLVSIIMPTYNRAGFISETIQSVIDQNWQNWELIIIDDGSDDNTSQVVSNFTDPRIKYNTCSHTGIDYCRNIGLQKSTGELIAFIDSDDLWSPLKLEAQVYILSGYPEAGFCLTGGYDFKSNKEPLSFFYAKNEGLKYGNLFSSFFSSGLTVLPSALMFRRSCLDITGNFKETALSHVEFILSLAKIFDGIILYEHLTFRRVHDSNYSLINKQKRHNDGLNMLRSFRKELLQKDYSNCLFHSHINFGENCIKDAHSSEAVKEFLKAWRYKPLSLIPLKKITKAALYRR